MPIERRPFVIVKQLRVRDLRDDDIVRVWSGGDWVRWAENQHAVEDFHLVDVQVVE